LKALILAAGLGTRLMPLTANTPKALVEVNGISLLELAIRKLRSEGFSDIIVNVHHFSHMVIEFLLQQDFHGVKLAISDESDELLDTGGAILKARWFLEGNDPFLVYNVDIVTSLSLAEIYRLHLQNNGLATLAVSERKTTRYLAFNAKNNLCGWKDILTGKELWSQSPVEGAVWKAFSGIHVISPSIFGLFTESGRFSVIPAYLRLASEYPVFAFEHTSEPWFDLGKPEQITLVSDYLKRHPDILPA
jgi:NDP-sugar pyrophosphorylase family protein